MFKITADEIDISHIHPNSVVSIYNLSGQVVKSGRADNKGRLIMDSLNLPKVTKDVPPLTLVACVPAKVMKNI